MMLFNGILCLIAAIVLIIQIKRTQNEETSQVLQKLVWIYWAMLMIIAIHHICNGLMDPWFDRIISTLYPVTDTMNAIVGIVLSVYLSKRKENRKIAIK